MRTAEVYPKIRPPDRRGDGAERKDVTILNPIAGGRSITSRKRAACFVAMKRALWFGKNAIRFVETDLRNQAAAARAAALVAPYDNVNRLMLEADLRNIPMVMPGKALGRGHRDSGRSREH